MELAGAYLALLLCDALTVPRHVTCDGRHGLELGAHAFFDPFVAIELALAADNVRACLAEQVSAVEAETASTHARAAAAHWARARTRILPRLVGPRFFAQLDARAAADALCSHPLAAEVQVCFVVQEPGRARYVGRAEARRWRQATPRLLEAALGNLAARSGKARLLRIDGAHGTLIVASTGDGFDASRLLLPGLHELLARELGSPFAAAVPHRDALFACPLDSPTLHAMRERAAREAQNAPHAISSGLLLVERGGRLTPLPI